MKKPDQFYLNSYKVYKNLPKFKTIATIVIVYFVGVLDTFSGIISNMLDFKNRFEFIVFMFVVGAVTSLTTYYFTTMKIAPIILQTDALLNMQMQINDEVISNAKGDGENTTDKVEQNNTSKRNGAGKEHASSLGLSTTVTELIDNIKSITPKFSNDERKSWRCSCGALNGPSAKSCSVCFKDRRTDDK